MKRQLSRCDNLGWTWIVSILKPQKLRLITLLACTLTIYMTSFTYPLALQKGIDSALIHNLSDFYWMLALLVVLSIIEIYFSNLRLLTLVNLGTYLEFTSLGKITRTILSRRYTKEQLSPGNILHATSQIKTIKDFILITAPQTILELGQIIISFVLVAYFSKTIALLIAATLLTSTFIIHLRTSRLSDYSYEYFNQESQKQNSISSLAFSLKSIKYHALESYIYRRVTRQSKVTSLTLRKLLHTSRSIQLLGTTFSRTLSIIVLTSGCIFVASNQLSIGELITIQLLSSRMNSLLTSASDLLSRYLESKIALAKLDDINNLTPEAKQKNISLHSSAQSIISMLNVTSRHPNNNPALQNISVDFPKSGLIVITGVSGSGKSTLAHTLLGINEYSSGRISYCSKLFPSVRLRILRDSISASDQDHYLFTGTLRENLCCGRNISQKKILHILNLVGLADFADHTPDRLNYIIDNNGRELSGGQKQKICLARALLRDNECYLFDEPTSALDGKSSLRIIKCLLNISARKLVICITHNHKIMQQASNIILMDKGSIIASGAHDNLMKSCLAYSLLYSTAKNNS